MAMSEFGKAFSAARKAGDKTFMFKGKKYTTETKEEKEARMPKKAAPEKKMPEAKSSGRGTMAGRRAEDKQETTSFSPRSAMGAGAIARGAAPKARPSQAEQQDAAIAKQKRIKEQDERVGTPFGRFLANRERRLQMDEADRMSRGDKYGMGMKKGGSVKKSRDGMATKGKTKGRMC